MFVLYVSPYLTITHHVQNTRHTNEDYCMHVFVLNQM